MEGKKKSCLFPEILSALDLLFFSALVCATMDQEILSLAAEKATDRLRECLQTLGEDDVSTGKPVVGKANVKHGKTFKGHTTVIPPLPLLPTPLGRQGFQC